MPTGRDRVELVTIGTELLLGFTIDTNAAFLGQALSAAGLRITRRTSVADRADEIRAAIDEALSRVSLVITTGGLGPTRDDISKHVVADLLGLPLAFDETIWQRVVARYAQRGMTPPESNRSQAMVPAGATALPNDWGTAPGLWIESARGVVVMLPGVPLEMRKLMEHGVLPRLARRSSGTVIRSATLRTNGIGESTLAERIGSLEDELAPLSLAYLPGVAGLDLRLTAWNLESVAADTALRDGVARLRAVAAEWVYGEGDADVTTLLVAELRRRHLMLAVAESCTGGMLGEQLTVQAGASDVFLGGVIAYDNALKQQLLGVPEALIDRHGAVSGEVAAAMARGVAERTGAGAAIAITGIAGPGGGSADKPVGTVWFGFAHHGTVDTHRSLFTGDRQEIRARAVQGAAMMLWKRLTLAQSDGAT